MSLSFRKHENGRCRACGSTQEYRIAPSLSAERVGTRCFRFRDGRRLLMAVSEPSERILQLAYDRNADIECFWETLGVDIGNMCHECQPIVTLCTKVRAYFDNDVDDVYEWAHSTHIRAMDLHGLEWGPFEHIRTLPLYASVRDDDEYARRYKRFVDVLAKHVVGRAAFREWTDPKKMREQFDDEYKSEIRGRARYFAKHAPQ